MKKTIKHEASRISTWGLGAIVALGSIYEYLPQAKTLLPPQVFAVVAGLALAGKIVQKVMGRKRA